MSISNPRFIHVTIAADVLQVPFSSFHADSLHHATLRPILLQDAELKFAGHGKSRAARPRGGPNTRPAIAWAAPAVVRLQEPQTTNPTALRMMTTKAIALARPWETIWIDVFFLLWAANAPASAPGRISNRFHGCQM